MNIAIVGKMGAGKSSLANYLIDHYGYTRVANAGALKDLAAMAFGPVDKGASYEITRDYPRSIDYHPVDKVMLSGREILQGLGQIVKEFDRDFWLRAMVRDMENKVGPFVCDDTRFPFEADFLHSEGWIIVKLEVDSGTRAKRYENLYGRLPTEGELNHPSETEVDKILGDVTLRGDRASVELLATDLINYIEVKESFGELV